ncbi:MAG: zinc ribbon domain-containing protein [Chloroflexi bacterium]|nr:zinc ribbon domain-containing protein [Chloroflexota bacterium]
MEDSERDPRVGSEPEEQLQPEAEAPLEAGSEPWAHPEAPSEPEVTIPAVAADATNAADEVSPQVSNADIEGWPSEPPAPVEDWPTEPPLAGAASVEAWPTEPPLAGPAAAGEWPTHPPLMSDAPAPPASASPDVPAPVPDTAPPEAPMPGEIEAHSASAPGEASVPVEESDRGYPRAEVAAEAEPVAAHAVPPVMPTPGGDEAGTVCPRCGTQNAPGLSFCRNCGQRLVAAGVASTLERPVAPEGTMACPRCGTHNRAGVSFCQNCGANLRGSAPGYVPPAVAGESTAAVAPAAGGRAILGPIVLLVGIVGLVTGYLLPFAFGSDSLFERAWGAGGHGISIWTALPDGGLAATIYFVLAAAVPILALLLAIGAIAGAVRARPGPLQLIGLWIALVWSVALAGGFVLVEVLGNWSGGDIVGLLRNLSPGGIILFLASLIVLIGALTRFGRS